MTEPLQVGQFAIVDGEPVDRGPNAGIFHGKGPVDDRAELYIVAEGTTPAGEAFAGHVVSTAGHAWGGLDMSLTGALQRIFQDAQRNLIDWNRKSIAPHRVSLGICCLGRRGGQAVIAQAGPSAAFHMSNGAVTAYFADEAHGRPLGAGAIDAQLTAVTFAPGDRLLLVSTAALAACDDEIIAGILQLPAEQVLPELWHRVQDLRHVTVVLVTSPGRPSDFARKAEDNDGFVIDATSSLPAPEPAAAEARTANETEPSNSFQPSLFIEDQPVELAAAARQQLISIGIRARSASRVPAVAAERIEPLRRASGENVLARLAEERRVTAAFSRAAALPQQAPAAVHASRPVWRGAGPAGQPEPPPAMASNEQRRQHQRRGSFSRGLVREEAPPAPAVNTDDIPLVNELAEGLRSRPAVLSSMSETIAGENASTISTGGSLVRVRSKHSGRWKGGGSLSRRTITADKLPPTWLVILVGLSILLTLVGLVTVPRMLGKEQGQRYATLIDGAQLKIAVAGSQQDATEKRKALTEAQALLLEARDSPDRGPEAEQLIAEVAAALSNMDAIKTPAAVDVLGSLEQFGDKPVAATRLEISADTAFVLDSASNQVIAMPLDGQTDRKVIYSEDKDAKRGRPIASAFLDSQDLGGPSLLLVDSGRALWAYSASAGLRQVAFSAPGNLTVTDIAVYGRDLYVLDSQQSVVYRFSPSDGGFSGPPTKVLDTPDLAAARRLMVDSEIVTADANGAVRRFAGTLSLVLSESGIDKRLVAPEAPQPVSKNGDLALLDASNDRLIVLRRDGAFDRQYRHPDFKAMSAFAIHNGVAYVFSGGKLRRVTF
ncbi:MAG: hypothetical protein HYX53_12685 [Chloroflexi bacterium]|nr:hypothetical protein [Chloroflexota bacterium]